MSARSKPKVTVVGGGLAGLITATEVAEAGLPVDLLEARKHSGGRARSQPEPYVANFGPHALYSTTALWSWLCERDLHGPAPMPRNPRLMFRWKGRVRRVPPRAFLAIARLRGMTAPVDQDLRTWATDRWGPDVAAAISGTAGPLTFDHDPGRLSAAFVVERIQRILLHPLPTARYVAGGWSSLIDRLAAHAESVGVCIQLGAPVDSGQLSDLTSRGPVIVAVEPGAARRLLGDPVAPRDDRRAALLDIAVKRRRQDPYLILDLDEAIFSTRPTAVVPTLAPKGIDLVQMVVGMRPGESLEVAEGRLEGLLDSAMTDWRGRLQWRRRSGPREATGAVDLPGTTWRDRPAITPAPGIWLAGDWVAAPGHLAEVSATSAMEAARGAIGSVTTLRPSRSVASVP